MKIQGKLIKRASRMKGFCEEGLKQLEDAQNWKDMINCFYDNIDFCIAKKFPSKQELLSIDEDVRRMANIFINEHVIIHSSQARAVIIDSEFKLEAFGYDVVRLYAIGQTKLEVEASQRSVVMIDAFNNSEVIVKASAPARVIVNLYGDAKCEGATVINEKGLKTYEL